MNNFRRICFEKISLMSYRTRKGSELAEFGPVLFVLFIMVMFPAIGLLWFLAAYSAGWWFNHSIVRELSVTSYSNWNTVVPTKIQAWNNTGLSKFTGQVPNSFPSNPSAIILPPPATSSNSPSLIKVTTKLNIPSMFTIPFFSNTPGMGAPIPITFVEQYPQQNPD